MDINELSELFKKEELKYGGCDNPGEGYWVDGKPYNFSKLYNDNIIKENELFYVGGDRMTLQNYASYYSKYLHKFLNKKINILEIGILKGIGLAMFSTIFPLATIYGFDNNLKPYNKNKENLIKRGANMKNIKVFYFDQLRLNEELLKYLKSKKIYFDIIIDDGLHTDKSILNTLELIKPLLSKNFVYIIEDVSKINVNIFNKYKNIFEIIYPKNDLVILKNK